jgi:hypothetical protein
MNCDLEDLKSMFEIRTLILSLLALMILGSEVVQAASNNALVRQVELRRHGIAWNDVPKLPIECPYQGEGWTISFSNEFYQSYKARGFSLKAMCLGLGSINVRFDPQTGKDHFHVIK